MLRCSPSDTVPPPGGRWVGLGDVECGAQERAPGDRYWPKYDQDVFGVTKVGCLFTGFTESLRWRLQDFLCTK